MSSAENKEGGNSLFTATTINDMIANPDQEVSGADLRRLIGYLSRDLPKPPGKRQMRGMVQSMSAEGFVIGGKAKVVNVMAWCGSHEHRHFDSKRANPKK